MTTSSSRLEAAIYIDEDVVVGVDTVIHPGVHLEGRTRIGQACITRPFLPLA